MKRSTYMAPVSLSSSYLMGSPFIGISMMTLKSFGRSRPDGTRSRFIDWFLPVETFLRGLQLLKQAALVYSSLRLCVSSANLIVPRKIDRGFPRPCRCQESARILG